MTSEVPTLTAPLAVAALVPWYAAAATAFAAVLFGRLNAVLYDNERIYQLDREAAVLIPIVVVVAFALFAVVSSRALRVSAKTNRPARAALVCGILALWGAKFGFRLQIVLLNATTWGFGTPHRPAARRRTSRRRASSSCTALIPGRRLRTGRSSFSGSRTPPGH